MRLAVSALVIAGALVELAPAARAEAPPRHKGFQLALRGAWAQPFGDVIASNQMNSTFSGQGHLTLDIGWKFHPNWFVGAYGGLGLGGVGGHIADQCNQIGASCVGMTLRFGAEVEFNFLPARRVNPWIGYGVGIESSAAGGSANGRQASASALGPEFAHVMGGVDFRLGKVFGIGPFVDFSMGEYLTQTVKNADGSQVNGTITNRGVHEWLQAGVRGVFFP